MVLHAQRRKAQGEPDDETHHRGDRQHDEERPAELEQDRRLIGADAVERGLPDRHLPGIADNQVQAERRHQVHAQQRHQVDAVVLEEQRQERVEQEQDHQSDFLGVVHTLRSSALPSSPSGRKMMTTRKSSSATPSLYAGETYAPVRFSSTPTSTPPSSAPRVWLKPPMIAA